MATRVTSRANPLVKRARLLGMDAAARKQEAAYLAEGVRLVEEALEAGATVERIFHAPRLAVSERGRRLLDRIERAGIAITPTSDGVLDAIGQAETLQGIVAIVQSVPVDIAQIEAAASSVWIVAWGLQDPGNVGTLLRTGDAAGADLFVTIAGTADPTSPKAVRASAGSIFRVPVARGVAPDDLLDAAAARGVRLFGTAPTGGDPYTEPDYMGAIGFAFGREGEGLPPLVVARLHRILTIPMRSGVESLNVSAAAAVVLFEAARRRAHPR